MAIEVGTYFEFLQIYSTAWKITRLDIPYMELISYANGRYVNV